MNPFIRMLVIAVALILLGGLKQVSAAEFGGTASVALLEKEVAAQDAIISYHERMKVYHPTVVRQLTTPSAQKEWQKHCDQFIVRAEEQKAEFLAQIKAIGK